MRPQSLVDRGLQQLLQRALREFLNARVGPGCAASRPSRVLRLAYSRVRVRGAERDSIEVGLRSIRAFEARIRCVDGQRLTAGSDSISLPFPAALNDNDHSTDYNVPDDSVQAIRTINI